MCSTDSHEYSPSSHEWTPSIQQGPNTTLQMAAVVLQCKTMIIVRGYSTIDVVLYLVWFSIKVELEAATGQKVVKVLALFEFWEPAACPNRWQHPCCKEQWDSRDSENVLGCIQVCVCVCVCSNTTGQIDRHGFKFLIKEWRNRHETSSVRTLKTARCTFPIQIQIHFIDPFDSFKEIK